MMSEQFWELGKNIEFKWVIFQDLPWVIDQPQRKHWQAAMLGFPKHWSTILSYSEDESEGVPFTVCIQNLLWDFY